MKLESPKWLRGLIAVVAIITSYCAQNYSSEQANEYKRLQFLVRQFKNSDSDARRILGPEIIKSVERLDERNRPKELESHLNIIFIEFATLNLK